MTLPAPTTPEPIDLAAVQAQVDAVLGDFLDTKARTAAARDLPGDVPHALHDFLSAGGKRLRPLLCVTGWHAAGGSGDLAPAVRAAAGLELFHVFTLIHDDVMDRSATRRGRPTVHRALAARHAGNTDARSRTWLGTCGAILAGDMALAWSDELLFGAGLSASRRTAVRCMVEVMREEVMYGQYLDLLAPLGPATDLDAALKVIRYKTAKYTIERPLHTGAALAGADGELQQALSRFAVPLGEAFQLRDDLLGVFGDSRHTGKPDLDDLREGKHTALLALAHQRATPAQQRLLHRLVGDPHLGPDGVARIRDILDGSGARAEVENMIGTRYQQALHALNRAPFPPAASAALRQIADSATSRTS